MTEKVWIYNTDDPFEEGAELVEVEPTAENVHKYFVQSLQIIATWMECCLSYLEDDDPDYVYILEHLKNSAVGCQDMGSRIFTDFLTPEKQRELMVKAIEEKTGRIPRVVAQTDEGVLVELQNPSEIVGEVEEWMKGNGGEK